MNCVICGCEEFKKNEVLWPELCEEWSLAPHEVNYINDQQGMTCCQCECNLRAQALAKAILATTGSTLLFQDFVKSDVAETLRILEINKAGPLHRYLCSMACHRLVEYPEIDMMAMNLPDKAFDLVVHSDTLEHIPNAVKGLRECLRVLAPGGSCIYTVPLIVGRMSRDRVGLPPSFHGAKGDRLGDFLVHHEFGCDVWVPPVEAGFSSVSMHIYSYPAALAIQANV